MARANSATYEMYYTVWFLANIRGHHVYKTVWTPQIEGILSCKHDQRPEAREHDENVIGVYKESESDGLLVGKQKHSYLELEIDEFAERKKSKVVVKNCCSFPTLIEGGV